MRKLKVVVSALYYPLGMYSYLLAALERREDVEVYRVGKAYGNWIPWNGGMYLPAKYVCNPHLVIPENQNSPDIRFIENQLPFEPDLWLQIDAGFHFTGRPKHGVNATILTDPHVLSGFYEQSRPYMDYVFNMQTPYLKQGDWYLPYACDTSWFYPEEEVEKEYDACLIGLHYEHRDRLVNGLRKKGLKVFYDIGYVYDEYRHLNNKTRVSISWSSLQDTPSRVFEAMGMGLPLVANRTPDISTFFVEGEHYLGFNDEREAQEQVMKLINNPEEASEMGERAYRKILGSGHTWDNRIKQVLSLCKLIA